MRKFTHRITKVNAEVVGLDLHKELITFSVVDRRGDEIRVGETGGRRWDLERLLDDQIGRKKSHIAFEASGTSYWVFDLLVSRYGHERVHVGHPAKIRAIANTKEKNNANDAFWLAYLAHEGRLPPANIPEATFRELRISTRGRTRTVRRRSDLVRRLRSHVAQLGECFPTKGATTIAAGLFLDELVLRIPKSRGMAIQHDRTEIRQQDEVISSWEERIDELAVMLPDVLVVERSIPGVRRTLASTILAETGDLRRFPSAKSYGRFTGLTPADRSTGSKTTHGKITREGSGHLRWALTQATMACTRAKHGAAAVVGEWMRRRHKRYGCMPKVRCVAARKLAESIWRLFHYGEEFDVTRPFGGKLRV